MNQSFEATDVTEMYSGMLQAFECDFNLALDGQRSLLELQEALNRKDKRVLRDIELLKKLSFDVRRGSVKIVEVEKAV